MKLGKSLSKICKALQNLSNLATLITCLIALLCWLVSERKQIADILTFVFVIIVAGLFPHPFIITPQHITIQISNMGNVVMNSRAFTVVGLFARIQVTPSLINASNVTGQFSCLIETPAPNCWNVTEIDTSSIKMNSTIYPLTVNTHYDENGIAFLEARFGTGSLISLLANQTSVKTENVTLSINGTTHDGYFWGSTEALFNYTET